jgi:hypothetical protein
VTPAHGSVPPGTEKSKVNAPAPADDLAVLPRGVHALELEHLRESPEPLLVRRSAEVLRDPEDRAAELLQITGGANLERHDRGE